MVFSSVTFLFYFLPIFLTIYYLVPKKIKNLALLLGSLFFYAWGEPKYVILMIAQIVVAYVLGLLIEEKRGTVYSKLLLALSVIISIGSLSYFKYADFLIGTFNQIFDSSISLLKIALPIGISFYTFQILSYTIDVYRGNTKAMRNIIDLATYIVMFPQLIAGPIVRYTDVSSDLKERTIEISKISDGITRFVIGLSKKVLIANVLGELVNSYTTGNQATVLSSWMYAVCVSLQVYYDFSGYSDMAIGLGKMLGFSFPENFRYPFESKSVSEFWRRWHMTLGGWFRDYLYIPLGGNRVNGARYIFNIFVVWAATGLWHGAAWNFVVWGLYFMVLLVIEKFVLIKYLNKSKILSHIYLCFTVLISFVIFSADSITDGVRVISMMFGGYGVKLVDSNTLYDLRSYIVVIVLAIIGSTSLVKRIFDRINNRFAVGKIIALVLLLIVVISYLINSSYNPFLYFRF